MQIKDVRLLLITKGIVREAIEMVSKKLLTALVVGVCICGGGRL